MGPEARKEIVLSGIRATGKMHLGNLLGAIQFFVKLNNDPTKDCMFFVANLHTLTTWTPPEDLRNHLVDIILDFLACGIDPKTATIYAQSSVPEISELCWLLNCLTPVGDLLGMTHFKNKQEAMKATGEMVSSGLLTYPVLMAADILGPRAHLVPVGQDQHAHVELARDIARRFNRLYNTNFFPIPDLLEGHGIRVPGLTASGKMSKSDESGIIYLDELPDSVEQKFRVAVTDPARRLRSDPGNPDNCPIFTFHHLLSAPSEIAWAQSGCMSARIGCVECKKVVSDHVTAVLQPIREARAELLARGNAREMVLDILAGGGKKARVRFAETVEVVKNAMGVPVY